MNRVFKKVAGCCTALALLTTVMQPLAHAAEDAASATQNIYVGDVTLESVDSIDLPGVLKRAMKDSTNIQLLQLKYAAQHTKQLDLETQASSMYGGSVGSVHLPDTPQELLAGMAAQGVAVDPEDNLWIGPMTTVTNKAVNQVIQGMGAMTDGMNALLASQREQMKSAAHQLYTDQRNTLLQEQEAREAIRLQTIAQYVQLLGQNKQLAFMKDYEATLKKEEARAKLMNEQGLASLEDVRTAGKALAKHRDDTAVLAQNYRLALVQLSFDIGIAFNPSLKLADIAELSAGPIPSVVRADTKELLKGSYGMKKSANNLDESAWQQAHTVTGSTYGASYQGVNMGIAGTQNHQTQLELTQKIEATYTEAEKAYQSVLTESRLTSEAKEDREKMKLRYTAGVISLHDLNKFDLKVQSQELALEAAKLTYYARLEKAKAMEKGFIS
ncbi:TolC family protein [Paenibacillus puerhi]|uniref:TolC family protein n=1 Tax=Paenibacillus puerhi TaxID=2692622 RepID=UPI00135C948A|nr:TolC family protein [Paenibacillus puerhi]